MKDYVNMYFMLSKPPSHMDGGLTQVTGPRPALTLENGVRVSIQGSPYHYSTCDHCPGRYNESCGDIKCGPYTKIEVGLLDSTNKISMDMWRTHLKEYSDGDPDDRSNWVYGYVPVKLVNKLIESSGGVAGIEKLY